MSRAKNKVDTTNIIPIILKDFDTVIKLVNDDWGTVAFKIPRNEISKQLRAIKELNYNSIYFLSGIEGVTRKLYVGQASIRNNGMSAVARLMEHDKNEKEPYFDIWNTALVITNNNDNWTLDDIAALEAYFKYEIPQEKNLNNQNPRSGGADYDQYTDKIRQVKSYVESSWGKVFEIDNKTDTSNIQLMPAICEAGKVVEELHNWSSNIVEVVTPDNIVKSMCDMIPEEAWNDKTVFLDIACKGGEYLKEVYTRLMECEALKLKYPDIIKRSNNILQKQIFGIALSEISKERATSNLNDYGANIRVITNYITQLKTINSIKDKSKRDSLFLELIHKEFGENMKVDIVIANPPYQDATTSIYQHFISLALGLDADSITMIVRNNWLASDTLKDTRNGLIDYGLKDIINYSIVGELFPTVGVGVSIFNAQSGWNEQTHIQEIRKRQTINVLDANLHGMPAIFMNRLDNNIVSKVLSKKEESFSKEVYPQEAFRITSVMGAGRGDSSYILDFEDKRNNEFNVGVLCQENGIQYYNWIRHTDVPNRAELINQYKVVACARYNYNENPITSITGLGLGTVCSSTFAPLYASDNQTKAYGAYTYIKTKFFRYLVKLLCTSGITNHSEARFNLVPIQDFTKTWTDQELYEKYGLTQEEINHIESQIKTLE